MKKFYIPYIVFCVILLTLFMINTVFVHQHEMNDIVKKHTEPDYKKNSTAESDKSNDNIYIVKASGENIFLYDRDDNMIEKLNIDFNGLRDYDKKLFVNGIKIETMEDLYQLLEDFSS